jgi:hypothetical protein
VINNLELNIIGDRIWGDWKYENQKLFDIVNNCSGCGAALFGGWFVF